MTAFDLSTSYAKDWELVDFVETVDWEPNNDSVAEADQRTVIRGAKIHPADMTDRRVIALAASIGATADQELYQFWPNDDAECDMRPGDFLRREEHLGEVVNTCLRSPFGFWLVACTKETRNVAVTT